jgi:hypothetical protein
MNKIFLSYSLLLFLFISGFKINAQNITDGVDGYINIYDVLKDPGTSKKIWITGNSKEIKLFTENVSRLKNVSAFKVKDADSEDGFVQLFDALSNLNGLQEIELTFNDIKTLPSSISNIKKLQKLIIWGSPELNYSELFKSLAHLEKLKSLELNSNSITSIPEDIKLLKNLESFTITDNESVNYIHLIEQLSELALLRDLSLEVNSITELPSNIIKLKNLSNLNISNNYISAFPQKMTELNKLDSIRADGNLFVNYVDEYNKLKGLNISYLSLDGTLTAEEKEELLKLFPKVSIDEKASIEPSRVIKTETDKQDLFVSPVPTLSVQKTIYTMDAASGAELNYKSGSQIIVPPNSFVDKNNQPVNGKVTLTYREFSDPLEIAFSGIPMSYSKNDVAYPMESAGMFQINASQNGEEIFLKKGKAIDVTMITSDTTDNYNFYQIDSGTKTWTDKGKQGTIRIVKNKTEITDSAYSQGIVELSPAWRQYRQILHDDDTVLFKDRFYDTSFCHLYKRSALNNANYQRFVRVSRYKKENKFNKKAVKGESWFNIKNVKFLSGNPEIRAFNGMTWVYEGTESPREFTRKYLRRKRYSDVRIERNGESFNILLKEKNGIVTIPAHPINKFKGTPEKTGKNYDRRFRNYTKALARRESAFNKNLMSRQQMNYRNNIRLWQNLKPLMSEAEKAMSFEKWMQYYNGMTGRDTLTTFQKTSGFVGSILNQNTRKMSITQFGYYNCDRPLMKIIALPVNAVDAVVRFGYKELTEPKEYASITVNYYDPASKQISPRQVMIIDKRVKSVAYLGNGKNMTVAINSPKNLIAVMPDGSVGIFSENKFKDLELINNSSHSLQLTMYGPNELNEVRRYLKY